MVCVTHLHPWGYLLCSCVSPFLPGTQIFLIRSKWCTQISRPCLCWPSPGTLHTDDGCILTHGLRPRHLGTVPPLYGELGAQLGGRSIVSPELINKVFESRQLVLLLLQASGIQLLYHIFKCWSKLFRCLITDMEWNFWELQWQCPRWIIPSQY